jgi:pimeloyl-ACP methyl ester carboxylesterase
MAAYVYDLAQLIHQQRLAPVRIIGHSLGGNIVLRYTGLYPEAVSKVVAIEGLGPTPERLQERGVPEAVRDRLRGWIDARRTLSARVHRRYASIEDALARMQKENAHLTPEQARYLTVHGASQNEDGTYSWKFDNYVRSWTPVDITADELHALWRAIDCPTLLVNGKESWASNPETDGRLQYFRHARVAMFENAGHWVHHDQLRAFLAEARAFLAE